jgi:hypothetical protein
MEGWLICVESHIGPVDGLRSVAHFIPYDKIQRIASNNQWFCDDFDKQNGAFKRGQIAFVLAQSFLNPHKPQWGHLSWKRLFISGTDMARERLLCLCDYFNRVEESVNMEEIVTFELIQTKDSYRSEYDQILDPTIDVSTNRMERDSSVALVDFANSNLHIHCIIPSLTQEEIIFSTCSECFLGLVLFTKIIEPNQVIVFHNVWRHATYSGYADSFRYITSETVNQKHDVIAMDACEEWQFLNAERDLHKAIAGFSNTQLGVVSTGNWGCGVFGGDPVLKLLQQCMATQIAGKSLYYSTFGDEKQQQYFVNVIRLLKDARVTIDWILEKMQTFRGKAFDIYIIDLLELKGLIE